jgi:hypothetical protein
LNDQARFELCRLGNVRNRGALETGFGFDDGEIDRSREFDSHGLAFVELDRDLEVRNQVVDGITEDFLGEVHLLVILNVHEVIVFAVVVQILEFMIFHDGPLHLVFGREAMLTHGTAAQVAHFDLHEASEVARRPVGHAEDRVQIIVELDDHARAQLC